MAELNEEQLLLLDNLMYFSGSSKKNETVRDIAANMIERAQKGKTDEFSGGFNSKLENAEEIGRAILNDPELCDLIVKDSINTEGVRASCFVNESGEATIAIRGTGGYYEPWVDNFQGAYQSDTTDQQALATFVNKQAETYTDITITGHSKGGNLAQYATVVCGDSIDRCVSFDGQGFSDEFLRKYDKEIKANSGKIKSVCAEGDYVNILLFSIAGETVYLETDTRGVDNHSSYYLWKKNTGKVRNNAFSETVKQSAISKGLDIVLDGLVMVIDTTDPIVELVIVNMIGAIAGNLLSDTFANSNFESICNIVDNAWAHLMDVIKDSKDCSYNLSNFHDSFLEKIAALWFPEINIVEWYTYWKYYLDRVLKKINIASADYHSISIDTGVIDRSLSILDQCIKEMETICDRVDDIKFDGELKFLFNSRLKTYKHAVDDEANKMKNLQVGLKEIGSIYINNENNIVAQMG